MIDRDNRALCARTQAGVVFQSHLAVGALTFFFYFKRQMHGIEHFLSAKEVAGWAPANVESLFSGWGKPEIGLERSDSPHFVDSRSGKFRGFPDGFVRNVME